MESFLFLSQLSESNCSVSEPIMDRVSVPGSIHPTLRWFDPSKAVMSCISSILLNIPYPNLP